MRWTNGKNEVNGGVWSRRGRLANCQGPINVFGGANIAMKIPLDKLVNEKSSLVTFWNSFSLSVTFIKMLFWWITKIFFQMKIVIWYPHFPYLSQTNPQLNNLENTFYHFRLKHYAFMYSFLLYPTEKYQIWVNGVLE